MAFRNLTNSGKAYLATRLANELPVKFTKAKIGNGGVPTSTDPAQTTELYGFKKQVTILKAVQEQNSIKLTIQITNDGINEGFYLKEIGIYVDDNGREVLYWYCNEDNSQYINAQTDTPLSFEVDIMMEVTNINSTVVEWTGKDTWVNKTLLNEELAKKLDKGAVSSEYDTAKKIEDKIKVAQSTADSKLDKGTVSAEYNTAAKMEAKIKVAQQTATNAGSTANNKLTKGSLPAKIVDAKGIYDLIENNSGLNFDPNLLFLNDAGTKTQDKIYFDRNKKGLFRCTQTTTTTTNSTTYFEDISNKSSADRLANLNDIKLIFNNKQGAVETGVLNLDDSIENFKFIQIIYQFGGSTSNPEGFLADLYPVSFIKQNYGKNIIQSSPTIEGEKISIEHLYFNFKNKGQIEIVENKTSGIASIVNNRIYQIYAWN